MNNNSSIKKLTLPLDIDEIRALKAGDVVTLSGDVVITAGIPSHQRILQYLSESKPLPIDLQDGALLHLGALTETKEGGARKLVYMNPTTSTRFNNLMPDIIRGLNLRIVGGKGGLDTNCAKAMQETGCIYLSFIGGGATLLTRAVEEVIETQWTDMIAHYHLTKLRVNALGPAVVGIDANGCSLYDSIAENAELNKAKILEGLNQARQKPNI